MDKETQEDIQKKGELCYKILNNFYEDVKDFLDYIQKNIKYRKIGENSIIFVDDKRKVSYLIERSKGLLLMTECKNVEYYVTFMDKEDNELFT